MRATYEGLLRVVRRRAAETGTAGPATAAELAAGWQAVVHSARHHFEWLRLRMVTKDFVVVASTSGDRALLNLAQAIGAGADLLASQNGTTSVALDDPKVIGAAQSPLAAVVVFSAQSVWARLDAKDARQQPLADDLSCHVSRVTRELQRFLSPDTNDLGMLGRVTAGLPSAFVQGPARIGHLAVAWQSVHESTAPLELLTSDLRSATAQLRAVVGYADHLLNLLPPARGTTAATIEELGSALGGADTALKKVGHGWRTRLSDMGRACQGSAESRFGELLEALQGWLRDGAQLRQSESVLVDKQALVNVLETLDELVGAAHHVARSQRSAAHALVRAGRIFVPKAELAKRDPEFIRRPQIWFLRYPQPAWVRTNRMRCFTAVLNAHAESVQHLSLAAASARALAGTTRQLRPYGPRYVITPRPPLDGIDGLRDVESYAMTPDPAALER